MTTRTTLGLLALAGLLASPSGLAGCKPDGVTTWAEVSYPWATQHADIDGTKVAYADLGQGERTLVLIHGLGSYGPVWKNNAESLAQHHRVIVLDLPGYGRSDKPPAPYSMTYFAQNVHALLAELDVRDPVLVGHSMGGQIAMTYALKYPDEYAALVLTSPAGFEEFEDGEAKWLANAVTPAFTCAADDEAVYVRTAGNFHRMPKDAKFMVDDRIATKTSPDFPDYCVAVSRSVAGMLDEPVYAQLPEIAKPVLVLFGKHDNLIPNPFLHGGSTVRLAEEAVARLPDADLVVLPRAGHMAQFEAADAWNAEVERFVSRLPAADASAPATAPAAPTGARAPSEPEPDSEASPPVVQPPAEDPIEADEPTEIAEEPVP